MSTRTLSIVRAHADREVPAAGEYRIDPAHASAEFTARHIMISKVRGRFAGVTGVISVGDDPERSSVEATVPVDSLDTGNAQRDQHLRSADFFDVASHPDMMFRSTAVSAVGGGLWDVRGDLTIRDVTREIILPVRFEGANVTPDGEERIAFSATLELDRDDWGLTWNQSLETGGVLIGPRVRVDLDVEALRADGATSS